jgi:hypothetical protein
MVAILQGGPRDQVRSDSNGAEGTFAVTNLTEDFAMDCNAAADAEICDVLGTLIRELIRKGVINGTVA